MFVVDLPDDYVIEQEDEWWEDPAQAHEDVRPHVAATYITQVTWNLNNIIYNMFEITNLKLYLLS